MIQTPKTLGLILCDQVIFEGDTDKPSVIGCFTGMVVDRSPSVPRRFDVFAILTDGLGDVIIDLGVDHLDTDQRVRAEHPPVVS